MQKFFSFLQFLLFLFNLCGFFLFYFFTNLIGSTFWQKNKKLFFVLWIPLLCKNCFIFIIFFVFWFSSSNEWMVILKRPTFKEGSKVSWLGKNPCTSLSMYIIFNNDSYERTFNASKVFFLLFFSFFSKHYKILSWYTSG